MTKSRKSSLTFRPKPAADFLVMRTDRTRSRLAPRFFCLVKNASRCVGRLVRTHTEFLAAIKANRNRCAATATRMPRAVTC